VIEGTVYHVEDVGQAIKGKSVDIFFASHEEAKNFGRQKLSVYLK
jgi:3D (Asp-Asp-Asp) domain-containing protein